LDAKIEQMRIVIFFIFFFKISVLFAQQKTAVLKDTSFTNISAYQKEKKKYPFIKMVNPELPKSVKRKENIFYKTIGDRKLALAIFYPKVKSKKPRPAVLLIHGGGWKTGDKNQNYNQAVKLAENGYVAITVEYRLSLEAKYPAAVLDVKAAVQWIRINAKKYQINPNQIAAMGFSAGGQLASLLGATNNEAIFKNETAVSDEVQAVINVDGILAFKHPESEEGASAALWLGGTYEEVPQIWEQASALSHVNKNAVPILFINSANPRFHAGRTDMINKLNSFSIYSAVHEFPNTPHTFWLFEPWFEPVMSHTLKFLDRVFK
jgi:acetyl esterase/lipase